MLVLTRRDGQSVVISTGPAGSAGIEVVVTVLSAGEGEARVGVSAPPQVRVRRGELAAHPAGSAGAPGVDESGELAG
jgi:sRNA-binding carbon storage regulator CsrA